MSHAFAGGFGLGGHTAGPGTGFGLKLHVPARPGEPDFGQDVKSGASAEAPDEVRHKALVILNKLANARDNANPDRLLATEFMYLPSAEAYPQYYAVIGNKAIALDNVRSKINNYQYSTLAQAKADFAQIFDNAKAFNMKGSQIYLDARKLKKLLRSTYSELTGLADAPEPAEEPEPKVEVLQPVQHSYQAPQIPAQTGPITLDTTQVLLPDNIPGTTYATRGPTIKPWLNRKIAEILALADKQTGRFLASQFQILPPKTEWPEYYRVVNRPISFDQIQTRNHRRKYETVQAFVDDVNLLLQNALTFHPENSQPWRDAKLLQLHFAEVMKEKPPDFLPPRKYNTTKRRLGLDTEASQQEGDARGAKRPRRDDSESVMPEDASEAGGHSDGSESDSDSDNDEADSYGPTQNGDAFVPNNLDGSTPFVGSANGTPAVGSPLSGLPDLPVLPDLPSSGPSFLHPDLFGYSGSPPAFSPMPNGSPAPSVPYVDVSKPQLIAKSNNRLPLVPRLFVSTAPQLPRQTVLDNKFIRQHSVAVPLRTERVNIAIEPAPAYMQQAAGPSAVNGHSHSLNIATVTRPNTVTLTNDKNVYSFTPKIGLTVVEFIVKPQASVQDSDADVYRCFVQRG
ncbi:hypothetical protein OIV83_002571 [Microbotryomycetes sp. JL201]|nr:hypothetical protein OIV83_002571 [Microbotryomycetes sp. JL201]